jgi:hypothetical protein
VSEATEEQRTAPASLPAEQADVATTGGGTDVATPRAIVLYLAAFVLLLVSLAVIGLGSIAGFSTSYFWISIVLSLAAAAAAAGAVFGRHRR